MNPIDIDHTGALNVIQEDGMAEATREIFEKIRTEVVNDFEAYLFMNTFIASNRATGEVSNAPGLTVRQDNPAGTYRSMLTPKGNTTEFKPIKSLGDVEFEKFSADNISLAIDTYRRTPFKLLYAVDNGNGQTGWLPSNIQSALTEQATSSLVRENNYSVYDTLKRGAAVQTDNKRGTHGRFLPEVPDTAKAFTNQLIETIATYNMLPEDRYVTGFKKEDLVIVMTAEAQAKLLEEKLVIYEGQKMGNEGLYYQGLPYEHLFAGVPLKVSQFINSEETADGTLDVDYIILPRGSYSPFLFHMARWAGWVEKAPFTDGGLSVYGTMLTGMKVEEKLDQHITIKPTKDADFSSLFYANNAVGLSVVRSAAGELELKVKELTGTFEYEVIDFNTEEKVGETAALTADGATITGLEAGREYLIRITGGSVASPETKNGKANVYRLYKRA